MPETPENLSKIFNMPAGDMMEKLGFLTTEQVQQSGRKQAFMVAIRNAMTAGTVAKDDVRIPQFKGNPDFLGLAKKSDIDLLKLTEALGIPDMAVQSANELIAAHQGVNAPTDTIKVPFIGQIHSALYGNKDLTQASLTIQQTIRAAETMLRLQSGKTDPTFHGKKGEFNMDNSRDDARLQHIQNFHKAVSTAESGLAAGAPLEGIGGHKSHIAQAFTDAAAMFSAAKKPGTEQKIDTIVAQVQQVAAHYDAQLQLPTGPAPVIPGIA